MGHVVAIIDPDTNITSHVEQVLTSQGMRSHVLADGDVLEFVRSTSPTLILLNVELPRANGYSLCNRLKRQADLKDIPIILTSSEATTEAFAQHSKTPTPANAYLRKPFSMAQLLQAAQALVPGFQMSAGGVVVEPEAAPDRGEVTAPPVGEDAPPPRPPPRGKSDRPDEGRRASARSLSPSLDELVAADRADEPPLAPSSAGGADGKAQFLRESLKRREGDFARAREMWAARDIEFQQIQDVVERKERDLERAKKAREDLVTEVANRDDEIGSLKADVELGRERVERLEREKTALAHELENTNDAFEREVNVRDQRIAAFEHALHTEQQARSSENEQSAHETRELQKDLDAAREELSARAEAHGRADAEAQSAIGELSARITELEIQLSTVKESLEAERKKNATLSARLREALEEHAGFAARAATREEEQQARIDEFERDKAQREEELVRTSRDLDDKGRLLGEANTRITDLEADLADAQGQSTDLGMQVETANARARDVSLELEEAQATVLEVSQHKARVEGALEKTRINLAEVEARAGTLATDLEKTRQNAAAAAATLEAKISDYRGKLDDAQKKLGKALDRGAELDADVSTRNEHLREVGKQLEEERAARQDEVRRRDENIAVLESQITALKNQSHENERAAKAREAEVTQARDQAVAQGQSLEADLIRTKAKLAELERQVSEGREKIADLTGQLRRAEGDGQRKGEELAESQDRISQLQETLTAERAHSATLDSELQKERANHASDNQAHTDALSRMRDEAKQRIQKLSDEKQELKTELADNKVAAADKDARIAGLDADVERLTASLEKEEHAHRSASERLDVLDDELETTNARAEALGDENSRLKGMLKKATEERDVLKRTKVNLEENAQKRESTLVKDLESIKRSRVDDEGRLKIDLDTAKKERDDVKTAFDELKRKAGELKRRYDETRSQAKDRIVASEQKSQVLAEELKKEKAERARERAQSEAERQKMKERVDDKAKETSSAADQEILRVTASLKEKEERVAKLSMDLADMRDALKTERTRAKGLEDKATALANSGGSDEYKKKYTDLVQKITAREQQFKDRYDKLVERNKQLEERHNKVMDAVKRAKESKGKA